MAAGGGLWLLALLFPRGQAVNGFNSQYFGWRRRVRRRLKPVEQLIMWRDRSTGKLRRFFTAEIALLEKKSDKARKRYGITIDGVTKSARAWAKQNGIPYMTVSVRLRNGWDHVRAVSDKRGKLLDCDGEKHNVKDWAARKGLNPFTLHRRINEGWPIDRALGEPVEHVKFKNRDVRRAEIEARRWRALDLPVLNTKKLRH